MTKISQKQIILEVLKADGGFVPSYKLEKENTPFGWLGTSAGRRVEELVKAGLVEQKMNGRYAEYKIRLKENI